MTSSDIVSIISIVIALISMYVAWRAYQIQKTMESENILLQNKYVAYLDISKHLIEFLTTAHDIEICLRSIIKEDSELKRKELDSLDDKLAEVEDAMEKYVMSYSFILPEKQVNQIMDYFAAHKFPYYPNVDQIEAVTKSVKIIYERTELILQEFKNELHVEPLQGAFKLRMPKN